MINNPIIVGGGVKLPTLTTPGAAADLLAGKQLIDQYGNPLTGTMPAVEQATPSIAVSSAGLITASAVQEAGHVTGGTKSATQQLAVKTSSDLTVSGATVKAPAGYYASEASKSVATATQATPSITVSSAGLITASAIQTAGYVSAGTKSATKQLTTKAAATYTPSTANQTIASGRYLTGAQTIKGDANLLAENIKSGVSIFGVAGSLVSGMQCYQTTKTYVDSAGVFTYTCGFQPKAALIFNNDFTSTTSECTQTWHDLVVFLYPDLGIYFSAYMKVSTQKVWAELMTETTFNKNYTVSFTSTGMTLEMVNEADVFDGEYTILLFA